jgi:hypothetical protein
VARLLTEPPQTLKKQKLLYLVYYPKLKIACIIEIMVVVVKFNGHTLALDGAFFRVPFKKSRRRRPRPPFNNNKINLQQFLCHNIFEMHINL